MIQKLLLALAACLPLALAGCSGGGGASSSAAPQSQSGGSGTQTPAAALTAAENAVAAARSARTAAAVQAAQRALATAVETAETAVETAETAATAAQAAVTRARNYRTAQLAILDGLQPVRSASLAAVRAASTPALAEAAYAAARDAVANAIATETQEAIDAARRALENALAVAVAAAAAAQAALAEARGDLEAAQDYREIQAAAVAAIQTQPEQPESQPSTSGGSVFRLQGVAVTHLEMTDPFFYYGASSDYSAIVETEDANVVVNDNYRLEVICPGDPPRGSECTADTAIIRGLRYLLEEQEDFGVEYHDLILIPSDVRFGNLDVTPKYSRDTARNIDFFASTTAGIPSPSQTFGGRGQYSIFYTNTYRPTPDNPTHTYSAALGYLHDGRPRALETETAGTATWGGAMVGTHMRTGRPLQGLAQLTFSFRDNTVDVEISDIGYAGITTFATFNREGEDDAHASYTGPKMFRWEDLTVRSDASFYNSGSGNHRRDTDPHPTLGYIDGDFYGPNAEESAGVFERDSITGAWLAKRGTEAAWTPGFDPSGGSDNGGSDNGGSDNGGSGSLGFCPYTSPRLRALC